jgi:hypothetical protein
MVSMNAARQAIALAAHSAHVQRNGLKGFYPGEGDGS